MSKKRGDKGTQMEEMLRHYFLESGYFVVRGVKFTYQGFDVTDVDLWLYMRPSSLTRERVNVDVKNKRTPQAIERIFWTKGLQHTLGLEKAIVATTDKRTAVRDFGRLNNVSILDGNFLSRLSGLRAYRESQRLSDEELFAAIDPNGLAKLTGNWQERIEQAKSRLLTQLDYSGCNAWLKDAAYFIEQTITDAQRQEIACRLLYLVSSFFMVSLDYILKDISFLDSNVKANDLREGFKHGTLGKTGTDKVLNTAMTLIRGYLTDGQKIAELLKQNIDAAYEQIPADILKEYFSKADVSRNLFLNARKMETLAYNRDFTPPTKLEPEHQAILGVILDFSEVERRQFFDVFRQVESN